MQVSWLKSFFAPSTIHECFWIYRLEYYSQVQISKKFWKLQLHFQFHFFVKPTKKEGFLVKMIFGNFFLFFTLFFFASRRQHCFTNYIVVIGFFNFQYSHFSRKKLCQKNFFLHFGSFINLRENVLCSKKIIRNCSFKQCMTNAFSWMKTFLFLEKINVCCCYHFHVKIGFLVRESDIWSVTFFYDFKASENEFLFLLCLHKSRC